MKDLFGNEVVALEGKLTEEDMLERKRARRRKYSEPRGHVAPPGTGPIGMTCKDCEHLARIRYSKTYLKCGLNEANWSHGPRTDIRAGDAACSKFEMKGQTSSAS